MVGIPGSEKLAWVGNDGRSALPLFNSIIWNPQVLLYDPETRCFEGRMEPEDVINRSTSGIGGFPSPELFGIEFWTLPDGKVAMSSNRMSGDGTKYQVFDPVLRVETPRPDVTASVTYREKPGYQVVLEKVAGAGDVEVLASAPFGQGAMRTVDVPANSREVGDRFFLQEEEVVRVSTDYEVLIEDVTGEGGTGRMVALAPEAGAVVLNSIKGGNFPVGTITVLNHDDGTVRFSVGSRAKAFGSFVAVGGRYLAVATSGLSASDAITVFDLVTGEELFELPVARSFAISGDVMVRWMNDELIGHRISSDEELTARNLLLAGEI
jgi:hypothetical protein